MCSSFVKNVEYKRGRKFSSFKINKSYSNLKKQNFNKQVSIVK